MIHVENRTINEEIETWKKNKKDILELKNQITKLKNSIALIAQ